VGGGPAGLSAALMLGRCRRRVLVCDVGAPRNWWSREIHGFLSRDGTPPAEFLRLARDELRQYESVELRHADVVDAARIAHGFTARCAEGTLLRSRMLLLATPGLYVCGDASREAQFVIVAAAEGAEAGMAVNQALRREHLALSAPQKSSSTPSRTSLGTP
jgi:thioredoxin reductase